MRMIPIHAYPASAVAGLLAVAVVAAAAPAVAAEPVQATLPGGATSLQETFNDWQVACAVQGPLKRCALAQEQANQQTRQRVLAVEMSPTGDRLEGVLVMPFGLALDRGVTLQIDDQPATVALKFRTCFPGGCLVSLGFDAKTVVSLRTGTTLKAKAAADGGQDQVYRISLKGFGPALDRVAALAK